MMGEKINGKEKTQKASWDTVITTVFVMQLIVQVITKLHGTMLQKEKSFEHKTKQAVVKVLHHMVLYWALCSSGMYEGL